MTFKFVGFGDAFAAPLVMHFEAANPGAACAGGQRVMDALEECERAEITSLGCRIELARGRPPMICAARAA